MSEPNERDVNAFHKWKSKHKWPEYHLDRQTDLRLFREKFGVEHGSNFHCPWCFEGKLFLHESGYPLEDTNLQDQDFYVCRKCELKFRLECLDPGILTSLEDKRKEERRQKREERKNTPPTMLDTEILSTLSALEETEEE